MENRWRTLEPRLLRKATSYVKDDEVASDLVQDCALAIFENPPNNLEDFDSWAFQRLKSICIDHVRRTEIECSPGWQEAVAEHEIRRRAGNASGQEAADELAPAVATLPPRQRQAVSMHLEGYSIAEIGEVLSLSKVDATRQLLKRARVGLRKGLTCQPRRA